MSEHQKRGVLFTAPDGAIYHIAQEDLEKFKVPSDKIESTILAAEAEGFVDAPQEDYSSCETTEEPEAARPDVRVAKEGMVVNIFIGANAPVELARPASGEQGGTGQQAPGSGGVGSTMSKYAAGSTMSKYAAGSTMSKYAAGSTMSKYAAGSTMSKYAAGSTMTTKAGAPSQGASAVTFYGNWAAAPLGDQTEE